MSDITASDVIVLDNSHPGAAQFLERCRSMGKIRPGQVIPVGPAEFEAIREGAVIFKQESLEERVEALEGLVQQLADNAALMSRPDFWRTEQAGEKI